jgi:CRP/FNR family transcriptional regulator
MRDDHDLPNGCSLAQAVRDAGGVSQQGGDGQSAFQWEGTPKAFILLESGRMTVRFRTKGRQVPWAECRGSDGQDCMPVTVAILSDCTLSVRATCTTTSTWLELPPAQFILLVHGDKAFRRALFAQHARRLPTFFSRVTSKNVVSLDQRIADWLLSHARSREVAATHMQIAEDLMTAREVVSRRLRDFAKRGWIIQGRGCITLGAPAALTRLARDTFSVCDQASRPPERIGH